MKLGLCLSGGGVKGAAHIGALKAFEEVGLSFDCISGTSSGSIVAALYAVGFTADEIFDIFKTNSEKIKYIDFKNIFKIFKTLIFSGKLFIDGLNSGEQLERLIDKACNKKAVYNISDVKKLLVIPSVDVNTGDTYVFTSKLHRSHISNKVVYVNDINLGKAVRASCSFPGIFSPVDFNNIQLVDGGVRDNTPWKEIAFSGLDKVICIVFGKELKTDKCTNLIDIIDNSVTIMSSELADFEQTGVNYLLTINTPNVSLLDTSKLKELYELGYAETKKHLTEILAAFDFYDF